MQLLYKEMILTGGQRVLQTRIQHTNQDLLKFIL